ncbi:MAG: hypothetical protein CFE25_06190 [Chitinophagaceae bacterium BSSC1]|nr:MAG: hypothetical protein CFE25_06190 [Chitinophagaceae bacterium BSSC1]
MKKKQIIFLIVLIAASILLIKGKITQENFDSNIWKTANLTLENNWSLRWDMLNDLRNNYKLVGMTKNEIINLLGEGDNKTNYEFSYYLGYSKSGINTGRLIIYFNNKNVVTEIKVFQG